ncbi:MAG: HEAT repeat domain-containing protein [Phycisphaerae bacterium]
MGTDPPPATRPETGTTPGDSPERTGAANPDVLDGVDVEPMTLPMLGRLFGIPLVIIGCIVGGAIVVVVLFGAPSAPPERRLEDLLTALEAGGGRTRAGGVLLPRDKEVWQSGLELARRLDRADKEFTTGELDEVVRRIATVVRTELDHLDRVASDRVASATSMQRTPGSTRDTLRLEYLILALGRTRRPAAVAPLIDVVARGGSPYCDRAIRQLGNLHSLPDTRAAVGPIIRAIQAAGATAETKLVGCTALSVLAAPGDAAVIEALTSVWHGHEGEVEWAAAHALARLGSAAGRSTFLDLLDRSFWSAADRYVGRDDAGQLRRYRMPPDRIDALLIAAIDAAAHLDDQDLWDMIERLKSDRSAAVRGRAASVLDRRASQRHAPTGAAPATSDAPHR